MFPLPPDLSTVCPKICHEMFVCPRMVDRWSHTSNMNPSYYLTPGVRVVMPKYLQIRPSYANQNMPWAQLSDQRNNTNIHLCPKIAPFIFTDEPNGIQSFRKRVGLQECTNRKRKSTVVIKCDVWLGSFRLGRVASEHL